MDRPEADSLLEDGLIDELKRLRRHYGRLKSGHFDNTPLLNRHVGQGHAHHTFHFFMSMADWYRDDIEVRVALGTLGVEVEGETAQRRTEVLADREAVSVRHIANLSNAGMAKLAALIRSWSAAEGGGGPVCELQVLHVRQDVVNVSVRVLSPAHVGVYSMPDILLNGEAVDARWEPDEHESDYYWRITKPVRANVLLEDDRERRLQVAIEWNGSTLPPEFNFIFRASDQSLLAAHHATGQGCELVLSNPEIDESAAAEVVARARRYGNHESQST